MKWNDTFYNTVYLSYPIPRKIYGKKNIIKLKSTSMDLPSENYLWYAMWYTIDSVHIPANTDKHGLSRLTYPFGQFGCTVLGSGEDSQVVTLIIITSGSGVLFNNIKA